MSVDSRFAATVERLESLGLSRLPDDALEILEALSAPPRLIAHHFLVHEAAVQLVARLSKQWPGLEFVRDSVLFGAATHDIGKVVIAEELSVDGNGHEEVGFELLIENSVPPHLARFTRTHGQGSVLDRIEDLLVCVADKCWKGKRDSALEERLCGVLGESLGLSFWDVFPHLAEHLDSIASEGDRRLVIQSEFTTLAG